jgi:hypothetical protein
MGVSVRDMKRAGRPAVTLEDLTPADRAEFERFESFLRDGQSMSGAELLERYGADYLGLNDEEAAALVSLAKSTWAGQSEGCPGYTDAIQNDSERPWRGFPDRPAPQT